MPHVLVTGAAHGIGRAIAEEFAAAGATLTLTDRDTVALGPVAAALGATAHTADLAGPDAPGDAVRTAWHTTAPVDVLVNAAGRYPCLDMAEATADSWDRLFAVNLRAPVLATAAFARLAVAAGRPGSVVNISSGAALRSRPGGGPYAASKAALEMATRAAALELGAHGIRVNAVSPGFVPVASDVNPVSPAYAAAVGANPLGRPGTPRDIARAVRWIAGRDAAWITGEILRVDGGSATGALHLPRSGPPDTPGPAPIPSPSTPDSQGDLS